MILGLIIAELMDVIMILDSVKPSTKLHSIIV